MDRAIGVELGALCRACGLCCDGSLFGRVALAQGEATGARTNRLRVLRTGSSFEQPCSAHTVRKEGRACSVYGERPRACHAFTCRLYLRHRNEGGPIAIRLEAVRHVRVLLRNLECATDDESRAVVVAEISRRIEADFARG